MAVLIWLFGVVIFAVVYKFLLRPWLVAGRSYHVKTDLSGKVIIVTGSNVGGIGYETARVFCSMGATCILACRNEALGEQAVRSLLQQQTSAKAVFMKLDLASFASVRAFAAEFRKKYAVLDILICNAGVMMTPLSLTADGFELQFGVNHLGHFLLTMELLPVILKAPAPRIVIVSSMGHALFTHTINYDSVRGEKVASLYNPRVMYGQSKLANVLFASELQRRLNKIAPKALVFSLHPGNIQTNLVRHLPQPIPLLLGWIGSLFLKTPIEGAQTQIFAALASELVNSPGAYLKECAVAQSSAAGRDLPKAAQLWTFSEQACGIKPDVFTSQ